MRPMVDLRSQYLAIQDQIDRGLTEVIENTAFINGPAVKAFAEELGTYLGGVQVIPCANGTDALQIAIGVRLPDLITREAEFAGQAEQVSHVAETRLGTRLVSRQHVHEIGVSFVKPTEIIVPAKTLILAARLPIAARHHAVLERPVVQHRQIEPAAVPGDEIRRVSLDTLEKSCYELGLGRFEIAETPYLERVATTHDAGDRHDAMLLVRQKIAASVSTRLREHRLGHLHVFEPLEAEEVAAGQTGARFFADPTDLDAVSKALAQMGWTVTLSELSYIPKSIVELGEGEKKEAIEFLQAIDDHDDVHRVYTALK